MDLLAAGTAGGMSFDATVDLTKEKGTDGEQAGEEQVQELLGELDVSEIDDLLGEMNLPEDMSFGDLVMALIEGCLLYTSLYAYEWICDVSLGLPFSRQILGVPPVWRCV